MAIKSKSQRVKILEHIYRHGESHYKDIAKKLNIKEHVVRGRLSELTKAGFVYRPKKGVYSLTARGEYYVRNYVKIERSINKVMKRSRKLIVKNRKKGEKCLGKWYVIISDGVNFYTIVFKNYIDVVKFLRALEKLCEKYDLNIESVEVVEVKRCVEV